jgi:hypothetical protein
MTRFWEGVASLLVTSITESENWSVSTLVANPTLWTACAIGSIDTEKVISPRASQRKMMVSAAKSGAQGTKHIAAAAMIIRMSNSPKPGPDFRWPGYFFR